MAIRRTETINASDLIPGASDSPVDVSVKIRIASLRYPQPEPGVGRRIIVDFEIASGNSIRDVSVQFGPEPVPADPEHDILDDNGNTIVPAGFYSPRIPSLAELRHMPIPFQSDIRTFGDMSDALKRFGYMTAQAINPNWVGEEV